MISKFIKTITALAALGLSLTSFAAVSVLDFTTATPPAASPEGTWTGPIDQGGFQRFENLSTDLFGGDALFNFDTPLDLSGIDSLSLTARRIDLQDDVVLTLTLIDSSGMNSAAAVFDVSKFGVEFFNTQSALLTDLSGGAFDASSVKYLMFSASSPSSTPLNIDATQVQAFSSVPEPSTYAAAGAGGLLVLAGLRRRRKAAKA